MKLKTNIMLHTEVLDSLESLSNQEIGEIFRLIVKWNRGEEVITETSLEKFVWATLLPKLERNYENYINITDRNKENGKKGGRPKKQETDITQENPMGYSGNPNNLNSNLNSNSNNLSKDKLVEIDNEKSSVEDFRLGVIDDEKSSVEDFGNSKGIEKLESLFPQRKRDIGITEINLWNNLTQPQKANLIKSAVLYVRKEMKNEEGKYIQKMSKWLSESIKKGIPEETKPNSTKKSSTPNQTFKYTDGNIWNIIEGKVGSKNAGLIWHILNSSGITKEDFLDTVNYFNKEELLNLIAND